MKRNIHGKGADALTPSFFEREAVRHVKADSDLLRLLYSERKQHAKVLRVLTRQIEQLEAQCGDLRQVYMATLSLKPSPRQ